jgi:hypothetical protein
VGIAFTLFRSSNSSRPASCRAEARDRLLQWAFLQRRKRGDIGFPTQPETSGRDGAGRGTGRNQYAVEAAAESFLPLGGIRHHGSTPSASRARLSRNAPCEGRTVDR